MRHTWRPSFRLSNLSAVVVVGFSSQKGKETNFDGGRKKKLSEFEFKVGPGYEVLRACSKDWPKAPLSAARHRHTL